MVPHSQRRGIQQSADMLRNRSTSLKLEKKYLLLLFPQSCARCINNNDVVAGNNAHSPIWTICGGSDAIVLSYGPIVIILLLGFCGGGEEGNQNLGSAEVIWGVKIGQFGNVHVRIQPTGQTCQFQR
jgi:hypothetical protein